jgi:hypothetical protein
VAKGRKRGNREPKKPEAAKPLVAPGTAATISSLLPLRQPSRKSDK